MEIICLFGSLIPSDFTGLTFGDVSMGLDLIAAELLRVGRSQGVCLQQRAHRRVVLREAQRRRRRRQRRRLRQRNLGQQEERRRRRKRASHQKDETGNSNQAFWVSSKRNCRKDRHAFRHEADHRLRKSRTVRHPTSSPTAISQSMPEFIESQESLPTPSLPPSLPHQPIRSICPPVARSDMEK